MTVVPKPGVVWIGEDDERHQVRIDRSYAIATKEVTVELFQKLVPDHKYDHDYAPRTDCPVNRVSWYDAASYCNRLSKAEMIPEDQWCYIPNKEGKYAEGMSMAPDFLKRIGYRLPTEAEWEHACRAGSDTSFSFGDGDDLIARYGWFDANSLSISHPVGSLKANDLGLYDMHGNDWEWCHDLYESTAKGKENTTQDSDDITTIDSETSRVLRGGGFDNRALDLRSSFRNYGVGPADLNYSSGFRPARTFLP